MLSQETQVTEICNENRHAAIIRSSAGVQRELCAHCCEIKIKC